MTTRQVMANGLTTAGWKKFDNLIAKANKEQLRVMVMRISEKLEDGIVMTISNKTPDMVEDYHDIQDVAQEMEKEE